MKVLIIEKEKENFHDLLAQQLLRVDNKIEVVATFHAMEPAVHYFETAAPPDLLFFETDDQWLPVDALFDGVKVGCPVVFLVTPGTARKDLLLRNSIAILDNPAEPDRIRACLRHYREMQDFFMRHHSSLFEHFNGNDRVRSRILIRKGTEYQSFRTGDIVYFFSDHKLVFLVDRENRKYLATSRSLSDLLPLLDPAIFYRANRKYIVNSKFILGFSRAPDGRFILRLPFPLDEPIWISQPNTTAFQQWIGEKL